MNAELSRPKWTDSHCHLPEDLDKCLEVLNGAASAGVDRLIDVGTDVSRSRAAIKRAETYENVFATAGVHPHDAEAGIDGLEELLANKSVVAVGECGLDYHYNYSNREAQKISFAEQIKLAHKYDLALVIHSRSAWDDTFDILDAEGIPDRTVFHCFTGGAPEAKKALDRGAFLSFSGIVTFKNAPEVREAAALAPKNRYLIETDSPYLAPIPNRGKPNQPAWVAIVGESLAVTRESSSLVVARETWANASELYKLP